MAKRHPILTSTASRAPAPTVIEIRKYLQKLYDEEEYDSEEGSWHFRSGGYCCECTTGAIKVARKFSGKVFGYDTGKNLTAMVRKSDSGGHDFAIVGNRYLVDYWAYRVGKLIDRPIFDLERRADSLKVRKCYGNVTEWEEVLFDKEGRIAGDKTNSPHH